MSGIEASLATWGPAGAVLACMIGLIKFLATHHSKTTENVLDVVNKNTEALTSFQGEIRANTQSNAELSHKIGDALTRK